MSAKVKSCLPYIIPACAYSGLAAPSQTSCHLTSIMSLLALPAELLENIISVSSSSDRFIVSYFSLQAKGSREAI